MTDNDKNPIEQIIEQIEDIIANPFIFLVVVGVAFFLALNVWKILPSLNLRSSSSMDIAGLFWGTATILAIVERSIELFIGAWRNPGKEELEQQIAILKEKTSQSLPEDQKKRISAKKGEIDNVEKEIANMSGEIIGTNEKALKTKNKELEEQKEKIDQLPAQDATRKAEQAKLDAIQAVIEKLDTSNRDLHIQIKNREIKLQTLNNEHLGILLANPILNNGSPDSELDTETKNLGKYKTRTAQYALYLGLGLGLFCSIAGIRILEPLVDLSTLKETSEQFKTFQKLDLVVSALGIAGGTKLFHGLPALISDTLSSTRNLVNKP